MKSTSENNDLSQLDSHNQTDIYGRIVHRVFHIEDTTWGTMKDGFLVRFRGKLFIDSETAYDQLAESLEPHGITPLFRVIDNKQTI